MNEGLVRISIQKALLFNIFPGVRSISFKIENNNKIIFRIHVVTEPTLDQMDMMYSMSGEVLGDFSELTDCPVEFIISNEPIDKIMTLDNLVFSMSE